MTKRLFYQQSEPGSRVAATAQRLSVKAKIMMALFALMLIPHVTWAQVGTVTYLVWIHTAQGTTQVDDWNKDDVFSGDPVNGGKVSYDPVNSKLTLSGGVVIDGDIQYGEGSDLEIEIIGTNIIGTDNGFIKNTSAGGTGALKITSTSGGTLTVGNSITTSVQPAIDGFKSVTLDGVYVSSNDPYYYDQSAKRYISTSYLTGTSSAMTSMVFTTSPCYPIWIGTSTTSATQLTTTSITTGVSKGTVTFTPATTTTSSKLSLSDATINNVKILSAVGDLVIDVSGTNSIASPDSGSVIHSVNSGTLTLEKAAPNSSLKLDCDPQNPTHPVIQGFSSLLYQPDFSLVTSFPADYGSFFDDYHTTLGLYYPSQTDNTIKAVNDALFTSVVSYGLKIDGTTVTSANAGNVFPTSADNNGKVKFLPDANTANSGTLMLTGASINGEIISGLDALTIEFSGVNTIGLSSGSIQTDPTVSGDLNLTIKSTSGGSTANTLTIDNTTGAPAVGGFSSIALEGVYASDNTPFYFDSTNKCYKNGNGGSLQSMVYTTTPTYMLWVGSIGDGYTQAIEGNLTNYYNNITAGTVSFSSTKANGNVLTLNNATIGGDILSDLGDLKIVLEGNNTIIYNSYTYGNEVSPIVSTNKGYLKIESTDGTGTLKFGGVAYTATEPVSGFTSVTYTSPLTLNNNKSEVSVPYDLWIGDVQVTSANKNNLFTALGSSVSSNGTQYAITFDPASSTLTLHNVILQVGVYSQLPNLKIYLKGTNTISNTAKDNAICSYNEDAVLTFECESGAAATTTLNLYSNTTYPRKSVIKGFKSVNYAAGTYLSSPTVPALYGFNGNKNLVDCTWTGMDTNLCSAVITSVEQYQLWIDNQQITAANAGNVFNDGKVSYNAASKTLYLNGVSYLNPIFSGLDALTVEFNGTNSLGTSSGYNGFIMSSDPTADLKFKLGTTGNGTLSLYESVGRSVICGFASVTLDGVVYLDASAVYDTTNKQMKTGGYTATNLSIGVQGYPLWIGSTQVTSANAGNIRNDGTLSYVHDATNNTGTLTLNGATLSGDISTSMSDLTIHVKGNNKISAASNCIRSFATSPGKLTFTKDTGGKLELDNASNGYSVIKGFNELAGVPLETKAPYEIYTNGDYYRLKQLFVAAGDTASIDNVWVYADTTYPIWVDGHQATSVSANNILGDAGSTASFNSNTLTLNVANIPGAIVSSLTSTLTISVKGNSTVSGGIFQTSNATAGLEITKDAAATGNVSLIVNPGREAAIRGFSDFTYDDFAPFSSDGATDLSGGISYESKALKYNGTALGAVYLLSKTDLATTGLTFTMASVAYTGAAVVLPTTATMDNGTTQTTLTQTTDYTVTGYKASDKTALTSAPIAAGNYYATIQGNGIYTGTADAAFTIDQADFTPPSVISIAAVTAQTYTGSEIKPTPTVTFAGTQLVPGTDFDYSYANNTNAALSTATPAPTVTINGKGNFKGTNSVTFTIDQVDLSTSTDIAVDAVPDQIYTGSPIMPTPTVKFNGNDLVAGAGNDFVYSYLNNTNAALSTDPTAPPTVTITGSGNFKNSTSVKFTILDRTASVTFGSGQTYKTFFSAGENLLVPNDVKAYVVTMVSGNTVNITQISYIHANVPVLLESSAGATNVKDPNETLPSTNLLKYASTAVSTDGNQYVLYSGEFVKATGTIPADRVYLAYSSPVRRLTIDRNNSATAIEAVSDEDADGEQWYDMQGRKINKPTKAGLYIKNGKKVVVNNK